jgi:hypothetical protein
MLTVARVSRQNAFLFLYSSAYAYCIAQSAVALRTTSC